jgi:hydrogenase maturation protein HypF
MSTLVDHAREIESDVCSLQRNLRVTGIVQGVGFRPYVWRLAYEMKLNGWVRNDAAGVEIMVEGRKESIDIFTSRLPREIPIMANVHNLTWVDSEADCESSNFVIAENGGGILTTMIGQDSSVCTECLAEMFSPLERRWRYPFINCTHCGPRYTLTNKLPYDRVNTSMAAFPLCEHCEIEYRDPSSRRFHAEPIACPDCGPQMELVDINGFQIKCIDPIAETLKRLKEGQIVAIKSLGGFHLACDALNQNAVSRLRERKLRDKKPFAVMVANTVSISEYVEISEEEKSLLESSERPIVLLRKKIDSCDVFSDVAPDLAWLGVMLPFTPIQWLLLHQNAGQPTDLDWIDLKQPMMLVMTSANPCGEPLVFENAEAIERLTGIADSFLLHNRDIVVRCDDSVMRMGVGNAPQFIRRSRGYTPRGIQLSSTGPSVLALGGHLKNTICITRGNEAYVSQHIGSLDNPACCEMLIAVTEHLLDILQVSPEIIAHDLHPDYFSTRYAQQMSEKWGVPLIGVQHHHAHIAAVVAEHKIINPVLGLALDGIGMGSDGTAWGGELLRVDGAKFNRLGSLTMLPLPGGDKAAIEPWRMAAAVLFQLGRSDEITERFMNQPSAKQIHLLLENGSNCQNTSSMGRWFDAAAGLLGICEVMSHEGQAAMQLEGLAEQIGDVKPLVDGYVLHDDGRLDLFPLLAHLADEKNVILGAALFHSTLSHALADWVQRAAQNNNVFQVALAGGCFLNHVLSRQLTFLLEKRNIHVLTACQVPPNDGGLSLGQAWIAMHKIY